MRKLHVSQTKILPQKLVNALWGEKNQNSFHGI